MNRKIIIALAVIVALSFFGFKWSVADAQSSIPPIPVTGPAIAGVGGLIPVTGAPIIDAGYAHTCMTYSGGVLCWGLNLSGQVGDGTTTDRLKPVAVRNLANVVTISLGYYHSCALLSDGTVWCWGENSTGQLGNGSTTDSPTPVMVKGLPSEATGITSGESFSCAIVSDGSIYCWGENTSGQLNDGTTMNQTTAVKTQLKAPPALISGGQTDLVGAASGYVSLWKKTESTNLLGLSNAIDVSGNRFTNGGCAVGDDNLTYCWSQDNQPAVVDGSDNSATVIAGLAHACALTNRFNVMCWGANADGELGNGTNENSDAAVAVSNLENVADFGVGANHACVLVSEEEAWCWGKNNFGQLGDNTTTNSNIPVKVVIEL